MSDDIERFRATLARLGLSQTGAARLMGINPVTVRKWVAGDDTATIPRPVPEWAWRFLWVLERHPEVLADLRDHYSE